MRKYYIFDNIIGICIFDNVICFREWLQKFEFKKFMMLLGLNLGLEVISTTLRPDQRQGEISELDDIRCNRLFRPVDCGRSC